MSQRNLSSVIIRLEREFVDYYPECRSVNLLIVPNVVTKSIRARHQYRVRLGPGGNP